MNYRYRNAEEMKDSGVEWIGNIPIHWKVKRVKHIFELKKEKSDIDNPVILSLTQKGIKVRDISNNEGQIAASYLGYTKIAKNDFVLNPMDLLSGYIDKAEFEGVISPAYTTFAKKRKVKINHDFYKQYFQMHYHHNFLFPWGEGVSFEHRWTLKNETFLNLPVIEPCILEQEKIANFLDEKTAQFDSIISKKEALIEKLEEAKKSLISEVVTGKVKVVKSSDGYEVVERKKEEMKDSGVEWLGDIPKKWNVKKIKYISKIYRGKFNHRPRNDPEFYDGEYPFIQTGDVANSNMYITKYTQTLNKKGYSVSKEFPKGTLIMTIAANIGDIAILDFNACFPDSIVGFTPNNNIDIKFMYYIYSIMKEEFMSTAIINTQMNLNVERIENLFIVVPNIEKQKIIVDYIESKLGNIMNTINKVRQQIQKLKEAKQSLISEAVTGKIEILD